MSATQHMLYLWRSGKDDPDFVEIAKECEPEAIKIFEAAVEQEKDWAEYLFKDGSMIGLNTHILHQYIEYLANIRMKNAGITSSYEHAVTNPVPWVNAWLTSDNVQVAPQETEITSYLTGQIDASVDTDSLGDFDL